MVNLSWGSYLEALKSEDSLAYYANKYGNEDIAKKVIDYHMVTKELVGISDRFNLVSDINTIPFGQFIMAEKALSSGLEKADAMYGLSLAVIRPLSDKEFDNTDVSKEEANTDDIINYDAAEILNTLEEYVQLRDEFVNTTYNGVFYAAVDKEESGEDVKEIDEEDDEKTPEELFSSQWYWYSIVRSLAGESIWNYERILMTTMGDIAPELAYRRHKQIIEDAAQRRRDALNNIGR